MGLFNWLFYILCGLFLFVFLLLFRRKFRISNFQSIVFSILFMLIISGFCSKYGFNRLNINIFLVFVFEMIFRLVYYSYILEKDFFDKSENNLMYYVILIILGYLLNMNFINKVSYVFLSSEDLRIITWFVMFIFIYQFLKDNEMFKKVEVKDERRPLSDQGIFVSYARLKSKYNKDINYENKDICNIMYAIMIYENYKRPKFYRNIDNFRFRFDGGAKKLGIMQVETKRFISDDESIELVYKKISKLCDKYTVKKKIDVNKVITSYDKEDADKIINIYEKISEF